MTLKLDDDCFVLDKDRAAQFGIDDTLDVGELTYEDPDRAERLLGRLESLHDRLGVAGSCGQAGLEIDPHELDAGRSPEWNWRLIGGLAMAVTAAIGRLFGVSVS